MMGAAAMFALLAGVLAFVAVGVGAVWWALFRDKARGRRRCPRCWHDLSATPGMTCGECGFAAQADRMLTPNGASLKRPLDRTRLQCRDWACLKGVPIAN